MSASPVALEDVMADTAVYIDSETSFRFMEFSAKYSLAAGRNIQYRIAVPSPASSGSPYDIVIQIACPNDVGWAGLAWGGRMTGAPLMVAWKNGNSAIVSSRYAT